MSEMAVDLCPVCGAEMKDGLCPACGFATGGTPLVNEDVIVVERPGIISDPEKIRKALEKSRRDDPKKSKRIPDSAFSPCYLPPPKNEI